MGKTQKMFFSDFPRLMKVSSTQKLAVGWSMIEDRKVKLVEIARILKRQNSQDRRGFFFFLCFVARILCDSFCVRGHMRRHVMSVTDCCHTAPAQWPATLAQHRAEFEA